MHDYIHPDTSDGKRGMANLQLIVDKSKEDLLQQLADTAAIRIAGLSIRTIVKCFSKLSKKDLDSEVQAQIESLIEQQNRIVHENSDEEITSDRVREVFQTLEAFARRCAEVAER